MSPFLNRSIQSYIYVPKFFCGFITGYTTRHQNSRSRNDSFVVSLTSFLPSFLVPVMHSAVQCPNLFSKPQNTKYLKQRRYRYHELNLQFYLNCSGNLARDYKNDEIFIAKVHINCKNENYFAKNAMIFLQPTFHDAIIINKIISSIFRISYDFKRCGQ